MNKTKPARNSLTIQALVVTAVVVLYQLFGIHYFGLPELPSVLLEALTGAGLLVAGYGRVRADTKLGKK